MNLISSKQSILASFPTCYACEAPKTSMEHAPPRCFFPEAAEYRKDLIKVPSCNRHNTEKSGDDSYALWHIAGLKGVNECGLMVHEKLRRMADHDLEKRNGLFLKRLASETIGASSGGDVAGRLDGKRMQSFLCSLARALYFHETFKKLTVSLKVSNMSNCYRDEAHLQTLNKREQFFASELHGSPVLGANPEVFSYLFREKADGTILVQMVFYGTLKHWVFHFPGISEVTPPEYLF